MTANAMGGTVKFEDALAMRLGLMKVSQQDMRNFLRDHPHRLSPGEIPALPREPPTGPNAHERPPPQGSVSWSRPSKALGSRSTWSAADSGRSSTPWRTC